MATYEQALQSTWNDPSLVVSFARDPASPGWFCHVSQQSMVGRVIHRYIGENEYKAFVRASADRTYRIPVVKPDLSVSSGTAEDERLASIDEKLDRLLKLAGNGGSDE